MEPWVKISGSKLVPLGLISTSFSAVRITGTRRGTGTISYGKMRHGYTLATNMLKYMPIGDVTRSWIKWSMQPVRWGNRPYSRCNYLEFLPLYQCYQTEAWRTNKEVRFLIAKWLLAFITAIRYKEHDTDVGSMKNVYTLHREQVDNHHQCDKRPRIDTAEPMCNSA